jgi:hypothetical protein
LYVIVLSQWGGRRDPAAMLPNYQKAGGLRTDADDINSRLAGPLMQIRKKNEGSPQPVGFCLLTVACCLLLVFQVRARVPSRSSRCMIAVGSPPCRRSCPPGAARRPSLFESQRCIVPSAALSSCGSA